MTFLKNLKNIKPEDKNKVGGKAFSLGEMIKSGINVPDGFVLTVDAFEYFLKETDLIAEVNSEMGKIDLNKLHTVEHASEKIQNLILSAEISKYIKKDILASFDLINCEFVAVRSSATLEDSEIATWAGQLQTFLNVKKEDVLINIKKCWASFFSARAIFYRLENELFNLDNSIAVIIQKMINSEKSGIAFSVHPVTQDRNQILIEAGFGLGEAIVSGEITPDNYIISKNNLEIIDVNVFTQKKFLQRNEQGGSNWKDLGERGKKRVLSESEIVELCKLVMNAENFFSKPLDIEWAQEKGRFYLTQSRSITTLNNKEIIRKKNRKRRDGYRMIFESEGFSVFSAYLNFEAGYNEFGGVISCEWAEKVGLYIPEGVIDLYSKKGIEIYQSKEKTDNMIRKIKEVSSDLKDKINANNLFNLTQNNLAERFDFFLNKSVQMLGWYKYTEEHYLFAVEEIIRKNLAKIKNKNKLSIFDVVLGNDNLPFDKKLLALVKNVRKVANFKLKIKKDFEIIFSQFYAINQEIARRLNLSNYEDIELLFSDEIKSFLNGQISYQEFKLIKKNRYDFLVINKQDNEISILSSDKAEKFLKSIKKQTADNLLKGQAVNYGKAIGRAVVVPYVTDSNDAEYLKIAKNFKECDILVAKNTTPEIMTIIKKAGAIVTEEGGITCHGAIVAREFNKPGIVGIKGISKKIKTGDLIEVDADNGITRIL